MAYDPSKFEPLNGWILVQKVQPQERASSGIIMPKATESKNVSESMGIVVAMSDKPQVLGGVDYYPSDEVSVGDKVVHRGFIRHANAFGTMFGGLKPDDFYLVLPSDIMGVVETGSGLRVGEYGEFEA